MLSIDNALIKLLKEQTQKKAELDQHIQFDLLGIDSYHKNTKRYEHMKCLAARIIHIENLLTIWSEQVALPDLMIEGVN